MALLSQLEAEANFYLTRTLPSCGKRRPGPEVKARTQAFRAYPPSGHTVHFMHGQYQSTDYPIGDVVSGLGISGNASGLYASGSPILILPSDVSPADQYPSTSTWASGVWRCAVSSQKPKPTLDRISSTAYTTMPVSTLVLWAPSATAQTLFAVVSACCPTKNSRLQRGDGEETHIG